MDKHGKTTNCVQHATPKKNVARETIVLSINYVQKTQLTVASLDRPGNKTHYAQHANLIKNAVLEITGETTLNSANATRLISAAKAITI